MNEKDLEIQKAVIDHLEEIKRIGVDMKVFDADKIAEIPLEKVVEFALSYQILNLDRMISEKIEVSKNTLSTLRIYSDMMKTIIGIKSTVKQDSKLSIDDPLEALRKSIKLQKEVK